MEVALLHEGLNEISASPESDGTLCLLIFMPPTMILLDNQHPLVTTILITLVVCYMNHTFLSIIKEWKIILSSACNNRSEIHLGDKFKHLIDVLSI
jgi:hypothetical protein